MLGAMIAPRASLLALSSAVILAFGCGGGGMPTATTTTVSSTTTGVGGTGGTGGVGGTAGAGGAVSCPVCAAPTSTGALADPALVETSGVVASLTHPGVFWIHNDSGDTARVFAVDGAGKRLATITISGAAAIDWEDIALGPCPSGSCLYLADVGDNATVRTSYTVYRVPEPATLADATLAAEALPFSYPDGPHNCETILVHPVTGAITLVTKVFLGESSIFDFPLPLTPGVPAVLLDKGAVKPPWGSVLYTGGDVHPSAKGVLLRTYSEVWYHPIPAGGTVASALAGKPCGMPVASETQGEAVGWLAAGDGYVTIGEGAGALVNRVSCTGL